MTSTLDGMIGPWSLVSSARYGFARVFGVSEPTTLTHLRWFRVSLTQARPLYIDLWNGVDQNLITEIANPVDDGTVGWQDTPLSTGAVLQPGGVYTVVSDFGVTTDQARADVSVQGDFPFPFLKLETGDRFPTTHTGYPTTRDLVNFYGVDVIVTPVAFTPSPPTSPPQTGDITNELGKWLDSTGEVQTHQLDGLPWLTKGVVDAIKTAVDALGPDVISLLNDVAQIPNRTSSAWAEVLLTWQIAGALTQLEIDAWNLLAKRAPGQLTGASGGGGSAFYGPGGTQVADGVEQLLGRSPGAGPFPGTGWVMADEIDFVAALSWAVPADLYTVDVYTHSAALDSGLYAGVDVIWRLGWWAPLNGNYAQERRYFETERAHLSIAGARMPGLLLALPQGGTGHVQAWTFNS